MRGTVNNPREEADMTMMDGTVNMGNGPVEVAPVAFLISRGIYAEDPRVAGPNGTHLGVGDRWLAATVDTGMAVTVERRADGMKTFLSFRADRLSDQEWAAFAAIPNPISVLATPPVAWFLVGCHGSHFRAPLPLNHGAVDAPAIKALLAEPSNLAHEVILFGIAGDEIRCVKVGLALDQVWRTLAEAAAATPFSSDSGEVLRVLARYKPVDTGVMFATAMNHHLRPRAR